MYCEIGIKSKDRDFLSSIRKVLEEPESKDFVFDTLRGMGLNLQDGDLEEIEFWNRDQFCFNGHDVSKGKISFSYELSSAVNYYKLSVFCKNLSNVFEGIVFLSYMYEGPIDRSVFEYKNGEGELYGEPEDYSEYEK